MNTKSFITTKYVIALLLVAATLIGSHLMMMRQTSRNSTDGYIINISGMQRMLSQRIALISNELAHTSSEKTSDSMARKLQQAFQKMSLNQSELKTFNQQNASEKLNGLYYGPDGVDVRVTHYLGLAESLLKMHRDAPSEKESQRKVSSEIAKIARNGFVDQLDSLVLQHQVELEQKLSVLERLQTLLLVTGLTVLLLEAFFIFRPMANRIAKTIRQLNTANRKLKSANDELTEFSYRISHDLRAPIASSLGLTQIISESLEESEFDEASEATERVSKAMIRLDELITDVITVSKNKTLEVADEAVEVFSMVDDILERHSHLPEFERIRIKNEVDPTLAVAVKKVFLKQSLENLISNAIKYSDPNEDVSKLVIRASLLDERCSISVADNGIGIPHQSRGELFEMFKRFHPRQSFGSGLGLYLVKQNVARIDGSITFEPLPKGSIFKIQFPITEHSKSAEAILR
jgi:signal transduction histidine kinase